MMTGGRGGCCQGVCVKVGLGWSGGALEGGGRSAVFACLGEVGDGGWGLPWGAGIISRGLCW